MKNFVSTILFLFAIAGSCLVQAQEVPKVIADGKYDFHISIYPGWMPWHFAHESGIMDKWEKAEGIEIEMHYGSYSSTITAFNAGNADGLVITNMDTLIAPVNSGKRCTGITVGFSNGNDAIMVKGYGKNPKVKDLKGQDVHLFTGSVSHYFLADTLAKHGMTLADVNLIHVDDEASLIAMFEGNGKMAVVTWNPGVMIIGQKAGVVNLANSSLIPGEILDTMVINSDLLEADPRIGRVLTGAWFEAMNIMQQRGKSSDRAKEFMAKKAEVTLTEFESQLKTTGMFWTPKSAADYTSSKENKDRNQKVRDFCVSQGLISDNDFGIMYPDGEVQGNENKVMYKFDNTFMNMAIEGKLSREKK